MQYELSIFFEEENWVPVNFRGAIVARRFRNMASFVILLWHFFASFYSKNKVNHVCEGKRCLGCAPANAKEPRMFYMVCKISISFSNIAWVLQRREKPCFYFVTNKTYLIRGLLPVFSTALSCWRTLIRPSVITSFVGKCYEFYFYDNCKCLSVLCSLHVAYKLMCRA